jgi:hypothetical protein
MTRNLRKWPLIFLILSVSVNANATVLYVRYSSDQIIIATDSKRTAETGQTVCVCKIAQIGDTFIASAGLAEFGEFDPKEFAREAINSSQTLVETRARFEELISDSLIDVLKRIKKKNPDRYDVFKQGAAVNMVFARFKEQPELVTTALIPKDGPNDSIVLTTQHFTLIGQNKTKRIFVGISKRVEVVLDRPSFWAKGVIAGVHRAMQISIEDKRDAGEPIDIVQLTKGSVRWYPREPQCDARSRRISDQPSTCNSSSETRQLQNH